MPMIKDVSDTILAGVIGVLVGGVIIFVVMWIF